jgi:hypothetical protein
MQVLSGGDSMDRNEPSTSGVTYHRNEPSKICVLNHLPTLKIKNVFNANSC